MPYVKRKSSSKKINAKESSNYIIVTKENKEFSVKRNLLSTFGSDVDIFIPVKKSFIFHRERKFVYYERIIPGYIVLSFENGINKDIISKVSKIPDVISFLTEKIKGKNSLSMITKEELNGLINMKETKTAFNKKNETIVIAGQYCGFTAKISKINDDYVDITILIKSKPTITIPIWQIGQEVTSRG